MESSFVYISEDRSYKESLFLENLLNKAKKGETAAFGELYNFFFKKIYTFIYYRVSHKETAEDLAEEVFLKAYAKLNSIKEAGSLEAWLYKIARNLVIDYYRGKKERVELSEVENTLTYEDTVIDLLNLNHQQQILNKLLKALPQDQQQIMRLKFFEGLENSVIAELTGKTEGAIRVIQFRAITKLRELFEEYDE
ncbi:MAG: sigma-70 family RNA polymerase sigma factor [Patescibacteria group bacterium]|nr:sigma-70 family RNA polymerase sigma factor [Patescibacteria group bacterium]